jgi:hypothetical protein
MGGGIAGGIEWVALDDLSAVFPCIPDGSFKQGVRDSLFPARPHHKEA